MPEVLPEPPPNASGSPRQRTVSHMRKIMAAAAVAGMAATTARSSSADAGVADGGTPDDGGMDSMFIGHDPAPDAASTGDASDANDGSAGSGFDSMFVGHDPAGMDSGVTDANQGYDSMFVGHDPAGQPGSSGGCSCDVPGRKGR